MSCKAKGFLQDVQQLLIHDCNNDLLLCLETVALKMEQSMLQQRAKLQWLKGGDQCPRVFFRRVTTRRAQQKIFQIHDENGGLLMDEVAVAREFVGYYERLLGGQRRRSYNNINYLRSWARHVITEEEGQQMTGVVTRDDVKEALFDIGEDKAPGPDGFSSGFFKAAWPVIGNEVTAAIQDFFTSGKLLKQINYTLLSLIPKVASPNVTKFVPSRRISSNILLAQELFSGYNRHDLPPRCALKIDLRMAYDTIEWDFVIASLNLFGFPLTLVAHCEESKFVSLYFTDDLLLFYHPNVPSVQLFRDGLHTFAEWSGLVANVHKSQLIVSKSALDMKLLLLATLGFQEGILSVRYLGLPLISSRLTIRDYAPLIRKVDEWLKGWNTLQLLYATRIQLLRLVISSLNVYWAMAFILPKGVLKEIEARMRKFL
ncbi:UNVERIFIED_CONTAM: hypothetical protein Slati_2779800 [Sesamum latifolium]|uniref:Reverse transcriptase domain-containing protein n=1 Tax=Sesamum latifolium TaxID=2727402 RepID=A0AAW2VY57_9LAMI